jgi:methylmalonyl-CoA mutase
MDFPERRPCATRSDGLTPDNKLLVANLITTVEQAKARENGHLAKFRPT